MNEIKIFLKESGSIAELYKDFNLYKGAYRNAQVSVYVPKSMLYTIPAANIAPAVKTGAILTAPNGSKVTTDSHGADYVKDETVGNVAYSVFTQILPKEYCLYSGTQTIVVNVVNVDGTNASAPAAVSVITSQTAQIAVQESAYVAGEQILDPTQAEAIQAQQTAQDVKIAQNAASINELQAAETSNSEKISQNTSDIAELQARAETGTTYIGQMEGAALPEAEALNAFVVANTDPAREPESGDTIVFLLDSGDAQTAYKYTYGTSGWSGYVMPPVQAAANGVPGVVEGTYGTDSENAVLLDIAGGKVQDIYFKDESGVYKSFSESINGILKNISGFLSGELAAAVANKAVRDRNGDIIDITYLTQAEGATKGFVTDYALPKQFGNVSYISSNGYVPEVPATPSNGIQFSVSTSGTSTVEVFELGMQLSDAYELTKNNFTTNIIWIEALTSDSASFRLVTQAKKAADSTWRTLSRQESGELPLEAGTPSKVTFYSNFSELAENVLSLESGDAIRQLLQVKPGSNKSNTYYVISNQLYPSLFTFNTNTMVISSKNFVTTDTAQTISGAKTFTSPIQVSLASSVAGVTVIYNGGAISVYPDKISVLTPQGATHSFTFPAESGTLCLSEDLAATLQQAQEAVAAAQAAQAAAEAARDEAEALLEGKVENLEVDTLDVNGNATVRGDVIVESGDSETHYEHLGIRLFTNGEEYWIALPIQNATLATNNDLQGYAKLDESNIFNTLQEFIDGGNGAIGIVKNGSAYGVYFHPADDMTGNRDVTFQDKSGVVAMLDDISAALADYVSNANLDIILENYAELDDSGKIPSALLPSYVDDVVEYANLAAFPATGESGKIYVALDTNKTYRWGGTEYVEISESLALGETSSTAYAGNKGKQNADNIAAILDGTQVVPKAQSDAAGRNIQTTYATKSEVAAVQVTVDSALSNTSENPVQNKVVNTAISDAKLAAMNYADGKVGTLQANIEEGAVIAASATKAIQDAAGRNIQTTYATKNEVGTVQTNLNSAIAEKQDTLIAGTNITIADNVISATGGGGTDIEWATDTEIEALFVTSFATASWEKIAEISESGNASSIFSVGDEKTIELTTGEQVTLVILGFDHDDLTSGGKAGITIGMKNLLATTYRMNEMATNVGGWDESEMRTSTMATLLTQLPSDLQSVIKQVYKRAIAGNQSEIITTPADKLWLFAEVEIDGTTTAGYADEGEQYEYWKTVKDGTVAADRKKYLSNGSGSANYWWLRSPSVGYSTYFRTFNSLGNVYASYANITRGVSFGFCV